MCELLGGSRLFVPSLPSSQRLVRSGKSRTQIPVLSSFDLEGNVEWHGWTIPGLTNRYWRSPLFGCANQDIDKHVEAFLGLGV
jgi:hypothetical protein